MIFEFSSQKCVFQNIWIIRPKWDILFRCVSTVHPMNDKFHKCYKLSCKSFLSSSVHKTNAKWSIHLVAIKVCFTLFRKKNPKPELLIPVLLHMKQDWNWFLKKLDRKRYFTNQNKRNRHNSPVTIMSTLKLNIANLTQAVGTS